jgi:hypothetical protein
MREEMAPAYQILTKVDIDWFDYWVLGLHYQNL